MITWKAERVVGGLVCVLRFVDTKEAFIGAFTLSEGKQPRGT
jgi:hypothetical protein